MQIDTGEFAALSAQVKEHRENEEILIRTIAWMTDAPRNCQTSRSLRIRPWLRFIRGGRR